MIWLFIGVCAASSVAIEPAPTAGVESVVTLSEDDGTPRVGQTISVVHRPGLSGEFELAIGITDGRGRVRWTPVEGGVAEVHGDREPLRVQVSWQHLPLPTLVLLSLLGIAALGALGYGLRSSGRAARREP